MDLALPLPLESGLHSLRCVQGVALNLGAPHCGCAERRKKELLYLSLMVDGQGLYLANR